MKKMLMLASVASMIDQFNMNNIHLLKELGCIVDVAANFEYGNTISKERIGQLKRELDRLGIMYFHADFARNIIQIAANFRAYRQIKNVINNNHYDFVHCHSPIGGVIGRLAVLGTRTKVIYTAHGFHFHKSAPLVNWFVYYPVEKICSYITDCLITINKEDYNLARKKMKAKKIIYVPGVGVDTERIGNTTIDRCFKRKELGIPDGSIVALSVGELNKNKNHETVIKAMAKVKNDNLYYLICGLGPRKEYLISLCQDLGLTKNVIFLGFRTDIVEICKASDIFLFPSKREGLGLAALEAMASGLPIVASNIHGIADYTYNCLNSFVCDPDDVDGFANAITLMMNKPERRKIMGRLNLEIVKKFSINNVSREMEDIYKSFI